MLDFGVTMVGELYRREGRWKYLFDTRIMA